MILFTADWHIKLGQKNVPVDWALNRYKMFFQQVHDLEKDMDLHIIGGDLFDKLPSMEELDLYFEYVSNAQCSVIIYSGNHEATKKGKTFFTYLKKTTNRINPKVRIVDSIEEHDSFHIVPYEFIHKKDTWNGLDKSKVVFSHVRGEIEPHVKAEIDLELISEFPTVYLGDLHSHSNCQRNMVYPGSPMVTSFHRTPVNTGFLTIYGDDLTEWSWGKFNLPQLIRKTVTDPDDMVQTDFDHTIYEIEGDVLDLAKLKDSDLLDKKLIKRNSDTALILKKDMTIAEELHEYLTYILELPEEKVQRIIGRFHDHATGNT